MIDRTKEIQRIIKQNGYTSYLEIGLGNGLNFKSIEVDTKIGVDPAVTGKDIGTLDSDTFFEHCQDTFDCIFIDGLHHADQVERDIVNSWNFLNKGGQIIIHDCYPTTKECQIVPRIQNFWCGDVWKTVFSFIDTYGDKIKHDLIRERVGLFIIHKKDNRVKIKSGFLNVDLNWDYFVNNKDKYYGNLGKS